MKPNYTMLKVDQGTEEWKRLRLSHLTASQAPIVMGIDPYRRLPSLFDEKMTGEEPPIDGFKARLFAKGHDAERAARQWFEENMKISIPPAVLLSVQHPDLMASLDGFNEKEQVIFEAKYMGKKSLEEVRQGIVKPHHMCQVQAQLGVSGAKKCIYFATDESGDAAMLEIEPDASKFEEIATAAAKFMKHVRDGVPPEKLPKKPRKSKTVKEKSES